LVPERLKKLSLVPVRLKKLSLVPEICEMLCLVPERLKMLNSSPILFPELRVDPSRLKPRRRLLRRLRRPGRLLPLHSGTNAIKLFSVVSDEIS